jgi:hypothetical protein
LFGVSKPALNENGFGRSASLPSNQIISKHGLDGGFKESKSDTFDLFKNQQTISITSNTPGTVDEKFDPFFTDPFNTEHSQNAFMETGFKSNAPTETNGTADWALFDDGVVFFVLNFEFNPWFIGRLARVIERL